MYKQLVDFFISQSVNKTAIISKHIHLSYPELGKLSYQLANVFTKLNLKQQIICTIMPNNELMPIFYFACALSGTILAPLSPALSDADIVHQLDNAKPRYIFYDSSLSNVLQFTSYAGANLIPLNNFDELMRFIQDHNVAVANIDYIPPDWPFMAFLTSGSTGAAKQAVHSQGSFYTFVKLYQKLAQANSNLNGYTIISLPSALTSGTQHVIGALSLGLTCVMFDAGKQFDEVQYMKQVLFYHPKHIFLVIALLQKILRHPEFAKPISQVEFILTGGAYVSSEIIKSIKNLNPRCNIVAGYGSTEVGCILVNRFTNSDNWESLGRAIGPSQIRINSSHQIEAYGPSVSLGYLINGKIVPHPSWVTVGDFVELIGNEYFFKGRTSNHFTVDGKDVYLEEIENVMQQYCVDLGQAAVAIPDQASGSVIILFIEQRASAEISQIQQFLRERLPPYKTPKFIFPIVDIPLNEINKINRPKLRQLALSMVKNSL